MFIVGMPLKISFCERNPLLTLKELLLSYSFSFFPSLPKLKVWKNVRTRRTNQPETFLLLDSALWARVTSGARSRSKGFPDDAVAFSDPRDACFVA
ncbi:hypothetical protein ANAPC5_01503 [Anaplasma phagocytophilum]|nr:hypothetical protein ANAPC5_01503 [Anaplasma phagocytophilum]